MRAPAGWIESLRAWRLFDDLRLECSIEATEYPLDGVRERFEKADDLLPWFPPLGFLLGQDYLKGYIRVHAHVERILAFELKGQEGLWCIQFQQPAEGCSDDSLASSGFVLTPPREIDVGGQQIQGHVFVPVVELVQGVEVLADMVHPTWSRAKRLARPNECPSGVIGLVPITEAAHTLRPVVMPTTLAAVPVRFVGQDWETRFGQGLTLRARGELVDPVVERRAKVVNAVADYGAELVRDRAREGDRPTDAKPLAIFLWGQEVGLSSEVIGNEAFRVREIVMEPLPAPLVGMTHED
jgi:hypothetical protein